MQAIGIVQEQHADRARLYRQWRQLKWPIFVDSLNVLGLASVPIPLAVGPDGVVIGRIRQNQLDVLLQASSSRKKWVGGKLSDQHRGDALFWKGDLNGAVTAYRKGKQSAIASFRLGVALRARFESKHAQPGDGQAAVLAWRSALDQNPRQYIWRRRLEQYGPRLEKPYNFYGWIKEARAAIRARGETPVALAIEPAGAELMDRATTPDATVREKADPEGKVPRDEKKRVTIESIVTRSVSLKSQRARVRVVFLVRAAYWNNESEPLSLHVDVPAGVTLKEPMLVHPQAQKPETRERRVLEFEIEYPPGETGAFKIPAYALYSVCDEVEGTCLYLRRDFSVSIPAR